MEVTGPVTVFHNTLPHSLISSSVTFPDPDTDVCRCGCADVEVRGQFVEVNSLNYTVQVPRIDFRSSDLVTSAFTHRATCRKFVLAVETNSLPSV